MRNGSSHRPITVGEVKAMMLSMPRACDQEIGRIGRQAVGHQGAGLQGAMARRRDRFRVAGFTLLELIIVVAIIGILAAIVLPGLGDTRRASQEAALKTNLRSMRDAIDQYFADKGNYPPSIMALEEEGYLRAVPRDPFTQSADTWVEVTAEIDEDAAETDFSEEGAAGVEDVHSSSELISRDGTPYSEW